MRRDNHSLTRYRAQYEQLADLLIHHRPPSITDVNIQTGEDPVAVRQVVIPLIKALRRETPLGISVCLGTLNPRLYAELKAAGASIYILKFEMAVAKEYSRLEAPGSFHERLEHIRLLARDRPGSAATIARRLAQQGISLESIVQRHAGTQGGSNPGKAAPVPVILITYATTEDAVRRALAAVRRDRVISGSPQVIRIEKN